MLNAMSKVVIGAVLLVTQLLILYQSYVPIARYVPLVKVKLNNTRVFEYFKNLLNVKAFNDRGKHNSTSQVVYATANTVQPSSHTSYRRKPHILLAVGVLSKLSAIDRRNSIRETWFKICHQNSDSVLCKFFTDSINNHTVNREVFIRENNQKNDTEYMPFKGGYNFSLRLLWMLKWFTTHFEFDFFLRVDDDYFICLDRLLLELPHRPKNGMYWGWMHCIPRIVRVDEGFMILSRDIITEILGRVNSTLLCHAFGDQAVALWIYESRLNITTFYDNSRVVHEVTSYAGQTYLIPDLCHKYLALHGTYPEYMHKYWQIITNPKNRDLYNKSYYIPEIDEHCRIRSPIDFNAFIPPWGFIPKPCKDNPTFVDTDQPYKGRER